METVQMGMLRSHDRECCERVSAILQNMVPSYTPSTSFLYIRPSWGQSRMYIAIPVGC
jgi:hypothetical protein